MDSVMSAPERAFDYVRAEFGVAGIIAAGVMVVLGIGSVFFWYDRQR